MIEYILPLNNRGFTQSLCGRLCELKDFLVRPTMAQHRTYKDECSFIERLNENAFLIKKGFVPNMKVSTCKFPTQVDLSQGALL